MSDFSNKSASTPVSGEYIPGTPVSGEYVPGTPGSYNYSPGSYNYSPGSYKSYSPSESKTIAEIDPRIELLSKINDDQLKFTLSGVDPSIANSIRRIILSEIPIVVFRVSPNDRNKCNIISNTSGLTNEIVKHRLSCIPIHIKDIEDFPLNNYILELNVQNNTDTTIYVTTEHFMIKDLTTGKHISKDKIREIFPPNDLTSDFIDFVRLKPKISDEIAAKSIHLTCEFDIGTAKEDGAYNTVATCAYGNTVDEVLQESKLQELKQKWKNDGMNETEIKFAADNWRLLDGKRIFKKNSYDFIIETIGVYSNTELVFMACKLMNEKLDNLASIIEKDDIQIANSENTIPNSFDIILENEDYTIGKVIEYFLHIKFFETKMLTFCGFKKLHPHDTFSIIRLAYAKPVEISTIKGHLIESINHAKQIYDKIKREFAKYMSK